MSMLIGDKSNFAIECEIKRAYQRLSFRALGFFVIYVAGRRYGVRSPEATLLACSFSEVEDRILRRGSHTAHFATEPDAGKIADVVYQAIYAPNENHERHFGISQLEIHDLVHANHLMWAPDGDEAFDDGSYILHFDFNDRVRLIAFRCGEDYRHDPRTLGDLWLSADEFYGLLQKWRDTFNAEWIAAGKISEDGEESADGGAG